MTITTVQFNPVNIGTVANDGTGDDLRTAFDKVNDFLLASEDVGCNIGNIKMTGAIEAIGNITTADSAIATNLYGLIQTPTQSQITSVGTLTGLTSSGIVHITNTTPTTAFNNGALVIDGGLGVDGDIRISGNLFVANTVQTSITTLVSTSPLVYFDTIPAYPYSFDIGFYGRFTGAVGNVEQHTGFVRNDADHKWYLFSNVAVPTPPAAITTQIAMTSTDAKYDTLVLGNIELKAATPTAITNGGTDATGNIGASGATFNYGYFTNLTGTLQTAAQNNITSASSLATVGTITSGTWSSTFGAVSGANLTVLTAGSLIGTVPSTVLGNSTVYIGTSAVALNRTSATQTLSGVSIDGTAGSVAASAITGTTLPTAIVNSNLQSLGTLSSLAVTGNIRTSSNFIATGGLTLGGSAFLGGYSQIPGFSSFVGIKYPGGGTQYGIGLQPTTDSTNAITFFNAAGSIVGSISQTASALTFNGTSTTARYADLAENYLSDVDYAAGTVVVFGGDKEITTTQSFADTAVAGVISTNPAYLMNEALDGQPVALRGRVPVKVQGAIRKGDLLVTGTIPGVAVSVGRASNYGQAVFAKALENKTTAEVGVIEAVII
jgi:hypothetical protein